MAKGNKIVVTATPRGRFLEGIIIGTPKPGIVVEIVRGTAPDASGAFTYKPAGTDAAAGVQGMAADGDRLPIILLIEDMLQGRTTDTAYVSGERCFMYVPVAGEEVNVRIENQTGTADDFVIGDKLIVDDGTGKMLISASTPESEPFIALETVSDLTADYLMHAMYTGY